MGRRNALNSSPVVLSEEDIAALTGGGPSRELIVTTYFAKTAFTGASVNDTITCTQIINTSDTPSTVSTIWRNQTTGADLPSTPSSVNLTLLGSQVTATKPQQIVLDCLISSGQSLSAGIDLGVYRLVGLSIPATFEPTTLTFQSSFDNSTYNNIYESTGVEKSVTVGISRRVILSPADFYGIRYIKVRGGTSASATNVSGDRTIKLIAES
jgi:hypothetical protein